MVNCAAGENVLVRLDSHMLSMLCDFVLFTNSTHYSIKYAIIINVMREQMRFLCALQLISALWLN